MFLCHWSADHDKVLHDYGSYLRILNRCDATISNYTGTIRNFLEKTPKLIEDLETDDAFDYLVYLKDERKLESPTLNQKRAALRGFYGEILEKPLPKKVFKYSKRPLRLPDILTPSEATLFLNAAGTLKFQTLFMTIYSAGLRLAEARHIQPADIDSAKMVIHIRQGKGMKDRDVMLSERLLGNLRHYWTQYRPKTWLFPGRDKQQPICQRTVQKACRATARAAGIQKKVTPHTLRHTFASHLLQNGVSLRYIQELLGHSAIQTTMIYLKVVPESLDVKSPLDMLDI